MLFKEKLLLSNCDSVRALDGNELRKRFLTGLAFADGVVLSPNALIDNTGIAEVISQSNVTKYLNEEGQGKLVIRGFGMDGYTDVRDYYHALPDSRSEEHTSELQSRENLVCRLLLEKKNSRTVTAWQW